MASNIFIQRNTTNSVGIYVDVRCSVADWISRNWFHKLNWRWRIGLGGVANSPTTFQNRYDSTSNFEIQNSSGVSLLNVDTLTVSNLLSNGNFEATGGSTSGWTIKNSATSIAAVTSGTTAPQEGVCITGGWSTTANSGVSSTVTFTPNTTYTLSFYAKIASGAQNTDFVYGRQDNGSDINCATGQTITPNLAKV
jgi:hypothetical protein